jgi:hypothetical protein
MLTGHVSSDNEAIIPVALLGAEGRSVRIEAAIEEGGLVSIEPLARILGLN